MSRYIEWRHDGRRIVLPILIFSARDPVALDGIPCQALLDTGSTTSGVTPRIVDRLGLTGLGKRPLGSAQGEGQAERYIFRIGVHADGVTQPAFPFIFEEIVGFELANSFQLDALIGMDILLQCAFSMSRQGRCRIEFG